MKERFELHPWTIIKRGFSAEDNPICESVFSLGNGHMGLRGNFEEGFSGKTLKGTYVAGVYYPDRTKVAWWKNGYPEYFAKVLNACDLIALDVALDGQPLDLAKTPPQDFVQTLDMQSGTLERKFTVSTSLGRSVSVRTLRFVSMAEKEIGALSYAVTADSGDVEVSFVSMLNGDVRNADANYDEVFWEPVSSDCTAEVAEITLKTKKTGYTVATAKADALTLNGKAVHLAPEISHDTLTAGSGYHINLKKGETLTLFKYFAVTTSRDVAETDVTKTAIERVNTAKKAGFDALLAAHKAAWQTIWAQSDIEISGDTAAQQAIRFNIFHLNQTYTGDDDRLNIGPKGFTGEKYGGGTYWDTEMFCLPFFLSTADARVAKSLLLYRYRQLSKAKENAAKLGLPGALFPMVTMNGEECHNEWEITFEEIHRNAAITLAIKNYIDYTGDVSYLEDFGIDVLVETARFWAGRVTFNARENQYMILGVTGPNEYENNVNNNWYTNRMAAFSLAFTVTAAGYLEKNAPEAYKRAKDRLGLSHHELSHFSAISADMYYPKSDDPELYIQQDGFLDKALIPAEHIPPEERPISQHWSWDRILRSCYIKQADVIQGIFNFPHEFSLPVKQKNFDFYEPLTVHESSLSSGVYSVVASEIGYVEKAYALFLRAARLDLDDYNHDTEDGLHITATSGAWLSMVYGFGGLRFTLEKLTLNPVLPAEWTDYRFNLVYRGTGFSVSVTKETVVLAHRGGEAAAVWVYGKEYFLEANQTITINR